MAGAKDIQGTVFQQATATLMARVENSTGANLDQAAVAEIAYTISVVGHDETSSTIAGHENIALDKTAILYDALQNDSTWTVDSVGYNFRHEIDVSQHEAFPKAGVIYQVRYEVTPVTGQKIVFRFRVRCI